MGDMGRRIRRAACVLAVTLLATPAWAGEGDLRVNEVLPDRRLPTVTRGETLSLSGLRGKKLLLIEFASW